MFLGAACTNVQGDRDEFTSESTLVDWAVKKASPVTEHKIYPGVTHFEIEVRSTVILVAYCFVKAHCTQHACWVVSIRLTSA